MNQLTLQEARDICRAWGYGGNVTTNLYLMAWEVLNASKPVETYAPVDWCEDDGSEGDTLDAEVKADNNRQYDERMDLR